MNLGVFVHSLALVATLVLASTAQAEAPAPPPKDYTLVVTPPANPLVGSAAEVLLAITPKAPWVLKLEAPFSAAVSATPGLSVDKAYLDAKDVIDPKADTKAVKATFRANTAGEHTLTTSFEFFLCTNEVCKRMKETASTKVVARE